jgi:hypothetical protein
MLAFLYTRYLPLTSTFAIEDWSLPQNGGHPVENGLDRLVKYHESYRSLVSDRLSTRAFSVSVDTLQTYTDRPNFPCQVTSFPGIIV